MTLAAQPTLADLILAGQPLGSAMLQVVKAHKIKLARRKRR
jgi:hypothetical protein